MRTAITLTALATVLACSFITAPAHARARVFVASYGNDANPCTFGSPCKTFQQAVNVVDPGGEVTAIDSAGFGPINITQAVTITSPDGVEAGIVPNPGSPGISINTTGDVFLRGLTIEGNNSGTDGISLTGGGTGTVTTLGIVHCVLRHFTHDGIYLQPTNTLHLSIIDTIASNNGLEGIDLSPSGNGTMHGVVDHSTASSNGGDGITVWGSNSTLRIPDYLGIEIVNSVASTNGVNGVKVHSTAGTVATQVTVHDTSASLNGNDGFLIEGGNVFEDVFLAHVVATLNVNHGAEGSNLTSFGDNHISGNINGDTSGSWGTASFH